MLCQSIWADTCFQYNGFEIARLHARTDLVKHFRGTDEQMQKIGAVMAFANLSGLIRDPTDNTRLQLACSVYIDSGTLDWLKRVFSLAAVIQAAEAHILAHTLADLIGARPAISAHPKSGHRQEFDEILDIIEKMVKPDGEADSLFRGKSMLDTLQMLQEPPCLLATGDENGFCAEFPFDEMSSLLRVSAKDSHPRLGNGMSMLLTLPVGDDEFKAPAGAATALALNAQELQSMNRSSFLGSWCPGPEGTTFVSFFPNSMAKFGPGCALTFTERAVLRARWATVAVFRRAWDYERAREAKLRQVQFLQDQFQFLQERMNRRED
jgi:hypothetical protein